MSQSVLPSRFHFLTVCLVAVCSLAFCLPRLAGAEMLTLTAATSGNPDNNVPFIFVVDAAPSVLDSAQDQYFGTYAQSEDYGQFYAAFGNENYGANLGLYGQFGILLFTGDQLYSGDESHPTLLEGTFDLTNLDGTDYTLSITLDSAVAPEPPSVLLLLSGCCALLLFARRQLLEVPLCAPRR